MFTTESIIAELDAKSLELDATQIRIDRVRKSFIRNLPFVKSELVGRQADLNADRIRVRAAREYMLARKS